MNYKTFTIITALILMASILHGATISYQYDNLHRLTQVDRSDGTTTVYTYDDLGNRTSLVVTSTAAIDYYCDNDGDGYYDSSTDGTCFGTNCPPAGCQAAQGNDCNDLDNSVYSGATELCDNKDNDCNSGTADGSGETWYGNQTNCGQGVCASTGQWTCSEGTMTDTCVASDPTEEPEESCNDSLDNDCDSLSDALDPDCYPQDYYCDGDGDGHADHLSSGTCVGNECQSVTCQFAEGDDCDDNNPNLWDCNTYVSDDLVTITDGNGNSVTFPVITVGGDTTITSETCQLGQVEGITLTDTTICADITTDAIFEGTVEVCITYDDTGLTQQDEESLRMVRCDDQGNCDLIDEARPNDTDNNIVCGLTDHFSIFAVGIPLDGDTDGVFDLEDNCAQTSNPGQEDSDSDGHGNICDADLDNDGAVGFQDFIIFKAAWLATSSSGNWNPDADFDSDGAVGFQDFTIFKGRWLTIAPWE